MELWEMNAQEILSLLSLKEVSAREVVDSYFQRIYETEPQVHAYLELLEPEARIQAEEADAKRNRNEDPGMLGGIPVALKDNFCLTGARCTCASKILSNWVAPYDATVVRKLKEQGAVIVGKTNMDEFAMGSSTETSAFGPTHNPWDTKRVPGGSSGGSAAAVAAGQSCIAFGSDTGGSVRQPAAFTGVYGFKPTYGLVSRYGVVAFASSLDQVGSFGQSVWDIALSMEVVTGHDPQDPTSSKKAPAEYRKGLKRDIKGLRIGVPKELVGLGVSNGVKDVFNQALKVLTRMGAVVQEISMTSLPYALDVYYVIAPSECSSNMAKFDGVRYGLRMDPGTLEGMYKETRGIYLGPEVRRRIMLGTFALSAGYYDAYYLRAAKIRTLIKRDFSKAFEKYDLILSPTTPTVAFNIGEQFEDIWSMYMSDVLTVPVNLAGLPALSMPCGYSVPEDGMEDNVAMPCGLQIIGKPFDEMNVLSLAYALESEIGQNIRPGISSMRKGLGKTKEAEPVG